MSDQHATATKIASKPHADEQCAASSPNFLVTRRSFLFGSGTAIAWLSMPMWLRSKGMPARVQAQVAEYPRQRIASLAELTMGEAVMFQYPWQHANATNYLIKLGQPAGGGVGPDADIVAFNSFCTHQGMSLAGQFKAEAGVAGPCPLHWTTFDLTRHGMVVAGHATLGLPQITLEIDGDDIFATGIMGLIFGYHDNRVDPNSL